MQHGSARVPSNACQRRFVAETELPAVSTYMGKGVVSDASEYSLMTLDSGADGGAKRAVERADLVIAIGYDIAEHDPAQWNPDGGTTVVHVDTEPAEVYQDYTPAVELVCDIGAAMRTLAARCVDLDFDTDWYAPIREEIVADVSAADLADGMTVRGVLPVLREVMDDADVLVSDVGSHKMAIAANFPTHEPNTCIISNGLASMGIAVPGALAADLATDQHVVAATGDGGFLMNAAEIETATRAGCGYTIVVFNDEDYGLIDEKQTAHRGEHFGTEIANPDFVTFAESFGIDAYRTTSESELRDALAATVQSDEMGLVEVPLA